MLSPAFNNDLLPKSSKLNKKFDEKEKLEPNLQVRRQSRDILIVSIVALDHTHETVIEILPNAAPFCLSKILASSGT
jgi:hypothetical protein